jgi:hypothetical protein
VLMSCSGKKGNRSSRRLSGDGVFKLQMKFNGFY